MRQEFETVEELRRYLASSNDLSGAVFQGLDLTPLTSRLLTANLNHAVFLGCTVPAEIYPQAASSDSIIFPSVPDTPFHKYRGLLYTPEELLGDYVPGDAASYNDTLDGRIYRYFQATGPDPADAVEALTRRLHDMSITDALQEFVEGKRVVAIMGGHSMSRSDDHYLQVAMIGRELTRRGYLVTTGGGPGAMEAGHLGAWFATRDEQDLVDAVKLLAAAPKYDPVGPWLDAAMAVVAKYPVDDRRRCQSLGIPTWLYGHEPPAPFALTIAKYFANSVREEGLLAIAKHGVIFTPGSAGTIQEIFQDACQNHYNSHGVVSPMVFMGTEYWTKTKPVFPLLQHLAAGHRYAELLSIHDGRQAIVAAIERFEISES